jgi:transketolase
MEGISHEAASPAGHLGLGRLILVYDDNRISIDGPTSLAFSEDVPARFASYGWHVARVDDGEDLDALDGALRDAVAETDRPSLVAVRTHIASGAPTKQDTAAAHGAPLGPDEVRAWKESIGWSKKPFDVPADAAEAFAACVPRGERLHCEWQATFDEWARKNPAAAREWRRRMAGVLPDDWAEALPDIAGETMATRKASGAVLAALAPHVPELVGGSADLTESTSTAIHEQRFDRERPGRFLHFGVREHAMGAVMNGLALHGGLRPFGGTFLVFSDYLRPSIRLAALMGLPVVYVFTHDSIGLGEDGPTHQPVEHLAALRAIPGLVVIRPADAAETVGAWRAALERTDGPTALVLSRQDLAPVHGAADVPSATRGASVVADRGPYAGDVPDVLLIATGSEVRVALDASDALAGEGASVRVVSMPSWELFLAQPREYRDAVLPPAATARVVVEAAASIGWERFAGPHGKLVTLDRFGASAPGPVAQANLGFTPETVARTARAAMATARGDEAGA